MALYPSLEDMKVDHLMKAQEQLNNQINPTPVQYDVSPSAPLPYPTVSPSAPLPYPITPVNSNMYPALNDYMGLELTPEVIAANMPEYSPQNMQIAERQDYSVQPVNKIGHMIAPLSSQSMGLQKAMVTNGIRELVLCKDGENKIGLRVQAINKGVFVNLVTKGSPAALAGLRFGDQILQINGKNVAGMSMDEVHSILKKSPVNGISVIVRDRPFERTVTLHKDSVGRIGFQFKEGKIIGLVSESSAARNGILTEHQLLEVDGQNVVGLKDKEITKIISDAGDIVTVTIIPTFIYQHMTKRMNSSLLKGSMDHSVPI